MVERCREGICCCLLLTAEDSQRFLRRCLCILVAFASLKKTLLDTYLNPLPHKIFPDGVAFLHYETIHQIIQAPKGLSSLPSEAVSETSSPHVSSSKNKAEGEQEWAAPRHACIVILNTRIKILTNLPSLSYPFYPVHLFKSPPCSYIYVHLFNKKNRCKAGPSKETFSFLLWMLHIICTYIERSLNSTFDCP